MTTTCVAIGAHLGWTVMVYRSNDYSVPTSYGFQDVVVKGFVEEVVILCRGEEIAAPGTWHRLDGYGLAPPRRA